MDIKLIASDLDGTLMASDHLTVTERTYTALKKAHDKGIKIALATGRPMALIDSVLKQVPFVDYVIYSNGACVYDMNSGKIIFSDMIDEKTSLELVNIFLDKPVFFEVYIKSRSCYQNGVEKYFKNISFPDKFVDEVAKSMDRYDSLIDYIKKTGNGIEKITLYGVIGETFEEYKNILKSFDLAVASSFAGTVEATSKTADKGNALSKLCAQNNITADNVMSFGDAGNDCSMLTFATHSFAMENASDECKSVAKGITKSNAEDGVAYMVEKYCLS